MGSGAPVPRSGVQPVPGAVPNQGAAHMERAAQPKPAVPKVEPVPGTPQAPQK
jgi:hypothetical protein